MPTSLAQARSFQKLGDRPLVVVTAARDAVAGWLPLQDRMATLSTNSSHRVVPYSHDALVTDETAAHASSRAIRDVIDAVRFAAPLKQSSSARPGALMPYVIGVSLSVGAALLEARGIRSRSGVLPEGAG